MIKFVRLFLRDHIFKTTTLICMYNCVESVFELKIASEFFLVLLCFGALEWRSFSF